jgi:error-prone DNA polymerase
MVICQGQLDSIVPLERASMPGRTVVQWDKEDCADLGIINVDLLGLVMMAVLKNCLELIPKNYGDRVNLAQLPAAERNQGSCMRMHSFGLVVVPCLHDALGHSTFLAKGDDLRCGSDNSGSPFKKLPSG